MYKANRLKKGDKVALISLSSGIMGESFLDFEVQIGLKRLKDLGLEVCFTQNAMKGIEYIRNNPEKRAEDLKQAFLDKSIKAIICGIGGDDSYRVIPYLKCDKEFEKAVKENPKIFIGYSDSTTIHNYLNSLGLITFYGMNFLTDFAELGKEWLPYTKKAIDYLFNSFDFYNIESSSIWYEERKSFDVSQVGIERIAHEEKNGYIFANGNGNVQGKVIGGCIEVLHKNLELKNMGKTSSFPSLIEFENGLLLLESSEMKIEPKTYESMIKDIEKEKIFENVNGIIMGKPQDEVYMQEYIDILKAVAIKYNLALICTVNVGHAFPHTLIPLGAKMEIDCDKKSLAIIEKTLN